MIATKRWGDRMSYVYHHEGVWARVGRFGPARRHYQFQVGKQVSSDVVQWKPWSKTFRRMRECRMAAIEAAQGFRP